jgi:hypothetical protein
MKKMLFILMLLVLLLFSVGEAGTLPKLKVEAKISSALEYFKNGKAGDGYQAVMDAILLTAPYSKLPAEVGGSVLAAKDHLKEGLPVNDGIKLIRDAYDLIKVEKAAAEKPVEPGHVPPLAEIVRDKLLTAREELYKGNAGKVVKLLLESLLLITPVPGR